MLDDGQALMKKEWNRNEPSEEIPRQYSTPHEHLTLTKPRQDYMRMDSTLNITCEGSQNDYDMLTTLRGDVDQSEYQQTCRMSEQGVADNQPSATALDRAAETPYTSVKVLPNRTSDDQPPRTSRLIDEPRRIQRARKESQEDALESARHLFGNGNGQKQAVQTRSVNEAPTTTEGATIETHTVTISPAVITTSTTTTATNAGTGGSNPFPPNGTPFGPTATATYRPRMWVQRISEGWTGIPPHEDTDSGESNLHVPPSSLEEEVPENLGDEWRILHPFELPGVRHPTDATPPNQRRLAENDALMELIQTTEYLEDIAMWGQRDYWLYPSRYGDPFYRGRDRGRGRGRREAMDRDERPHERDPTRGFRRGYAQGRFERGNGRGYLPQGPLDINERYNQAEDWSDPAIEGRRNDTHMYSPTAQGRHQRNIPSSPCPVRRYILYRLVIGQDLPMRSHLHRMFQ